MDENSYFLGALGKFTFEVSSGAAIRHLADLGYTAEEIADKLTFPTPMDKIKTAYTKHLLNQGILAIDNPSEKKAEIHTYIRERGDYGRVSFRQVKVETEESNDKEYVECHFTTSGRLREELNTILTRQQYDYLDSIKWQMGIRYHLLNDRMKEIMERINNQEKGNDI